MAANFCVPTAEAGVGERQHEQGDLQERKDLVWSHFAAFHGEH